MWGKSKWITKYEKRIVTCNVEIAQCENENVKCKKKVRKPLNVTKELSYVLLEPHNMKMKSSNVRKELLYVILELHNVRIEPSNVRKK